LLLAHSSRPKSKNKTAAPACTLADDYLGNVIKLRETLDMAKLPVFTTERLILREMTESDAPAYEKNFVKSF
jgi:hypothetical protein